MMRNVSSLPELSANASAPAKSLVSGLNGKLLHQSLAQPQTSLRPSPSALSTSKTRCPSHTLGLRSAMHVCKCSLNVSPPHFFFKWHFQEKNTIVTSPPNFEEVLWLGWLGKKFTSSTKKNVWETSICKACGVTGKDRQITWRTVTCLHYSSILVQSPTCKFPGSR